MVRKRAGGRECVVEGRKRVDWPAVGRASSKVTVWAVVSLFIQVTLLPLRTVRVAGSNAKSLISTAVEPLVGATGATEPAWLREAAGGTELA